MPRDCPGRQRLTRYDDYDPSGKPTSIFDSNNQGTVLSYEEDRLLMHGKNYNYTHYTYGDGRHFLTSILYPSNNHEVFCYRAGTSMGACKGGTLTEKLQWKAKAGWSDGTNWTERVVYAYWPDGTLKEERYLTWTGTEAQTRRVLKYAADAHRRPTWQKWGEGAGSFPSAKSFDGADNLTGVGLPFNAPPAWCGGVKSGMGPLEDGTPLSQVCSSMAYDRANRLVQVDEYPADGVAQRTLFQYDAQGNVSGVKTGCLATDSFDTCSQPASTYTYDDFGRVVEVRLPHADGPVRYAYDALGNVVVKETEAMRQSGEYLSYTYDMLSRPVSAQRVSSAGSGAPLPLRLRHAGRVSVGVQGLDQSRCLHEYSYAGAGTCTGTIPSEGPGTSTTRWGASLAKSGCARARRRAAPSPTRTLTPITRTHATETSPR